MPRPGARCVSASRLARVRHANAFHDGAATGDGGLLSVTSIRRETLKIRTRLYQGLDG